jgi:trehalose-phosphatase
MQTQNRNEKLKKFIFSFQSYLNKTDKLALLLDFDGTLADLTSHPNLTILREEVRTVLRDLSQHPNVYVSIISGRAVREVKEKVSSIIS